MLFEDYNRRTHLRGVKLVKPNSKMKIPIRARIDLNDYIIRYTNTIFRKNLYMVINELATRYTKHRATIQALVALTHPEQRALALLRVFGNRGLKPYLTFQLINFHWNVARHSNDLLHCLAWIFQKEQTLLKRAVEPGRKKLLQLKHHRLTTTVKT